MTPIRVIVDRRPDERADGSRDDEARRRAEELDDGTLDPDELDREPGWWNEGSDDEA